MEQVTDHPKIKAGAMGMNLARLKLTAI